MRWFPQNLFSKFPAVSFITSHYWQGKVLIHYNTFVCIFSKNFGVLVVSGELDNTNHRNSRSKNTPVIIKIMEETWILNIYLESSCCILGPGFWRWPSQVKTDEDLINILPWLMIFDWQLGKLVTRNINKWFMSRFLLHRNSFAEIFYSWDYED